MMPVTGEGRRGIFVLAEAPGKTEDERGEQLVGESGQLLRRELSTLGVDLDRDCWKLNAVNCRPIENRRPTPDEIIACNPIVVSAICERQPHVVVTLGAVALESLLLKRRQGEALGSIATWRGMTIPDHRLNTWIAPTFHPSYLLRQGEGGTQAQNRYRRPSERENKGPAGKLFRRYTYDPSDLPIAGRDISALSALWRADLARAIKQVEIPLPSPPPQIEFLQLPTGREAARLLGELASEPLGPPVAVDFETTGLKPHAAGHRIVSCAVAWGPDQAVAFLLDNPPNLITPQLRAFLTSSRRKIGANIKFEHSWATYCLGVETRNWVWDCVLAAHVLDNRSGICSVKTQAFLRLGMEHWGQEVEPYLHSSGKDANEFNRVEELARENPRQLLLYNGLDALVEWRLAHAQRTAMQGMEMEV